MKKMIFLSILMAGLFASCSSDDKAKECEIQVVGMGGSSPDDPDATYYIQYGTDSQNFEIAWVSQEVYDYYRPIFTEGDKCWEGIPE